MDGKGVRVAVVLLAALGAAAGRPTEYVRVGGPGGTESLEVPAAWQSAVAEGRNTLFSVQLMAEHLDHQVVFDVYEMEGMRRCVSQPWYEREAVTKRENAFESQVELEPAPHLVVHFLDGGERWRRVLAYRIVARRGFSITMYCKNDAWAGLREHFWHAFDSFESTRAPYPAKADAFEAGVEDGYHWWIAPGVQAHDVRSLRRYLLDLEKAWSKLHGPLPREPDNLPIVAIARDEAHHRRLDRSILDVYKPFGGYGCDPAGGRLFAIPMDPHDPAHRRNVGFEAGYLYFTQCYGRSTLVWAAYGEALVLSRQAQLRHGLPRVPEDLHEDVRTVDLVPLRVLAKAKGASDLLTFREQSFAWVAFFHAGPRPYRKAYERFLQRLRETGDAEGAQADELLSLDAERTLEQCRRFVERRLGPARVR